MVLFFHLRSNLIPSKARAPVPASECLTGENSSCSIHKPSTCLVHSTQNRPGMLVPIPPATVVSLVVCVSVSRVTVWKGSAWRIHPFGDALGDFNDRTEGKMGPASFFVLFLVCFESKLCKTHRKFVSCQNYQRIKYLSSSVWVAIDNSYVRRRCYLIDTFSDGMSDGLFTGMRKLIVNSCRYFLKKFLRTGSQVGSRREAACSLVRDKSSAFTCSQLYL